MTNWKSLTQKVSTCHDEFKASVVSNTEEPLSKGSIVNLTEEEDLFTQKGMKVSPKKLRGWLWNKKNLRALSRDAFVIWSAYDDEKDLSYAGVGSFITGELKSRFPPTHVVTMGTDETETS